LRGVGHDRHAGDHGFHIGDPLVNLGLENIHLN
jgi:hypothetical protein